MGFLSSKNWVKSSRTVTLLSFVVVVFGALFAHADSSPSTHVVVLVPGFFNSLVPGSDDDSPPYFSEDIIQIFETAGYHTYVVDNLDPIGGLKDNTELLTEYLQDVVKAEPGMRMILIGHSAGGLYSLGLMSEPQSQFPVDEIMTLATPFQGVNFAQYLRDGGFIARGILDSMDLQSLLEFTPGYMEDVTRAWNLPSSLKVHVFYGYQTQDLMTTPLKITSELNGVKSDGIVPVTSALGFQGAQVTLHSADYIHLDHWEQVLDYRLFSIFRHTNIQAIRAEQVRFYHQILNSL